MKEREAVLQSDVKEARARGGRGVELLSMIMNWLNAYCLPIARRAGLCVSVLGRVKTVIAGRTDLRRSCVQSSVIYQYVKGHRSDLEELLRS